MAITDENRKKMKEGYFRFWSSPKGLIAAEARKKQMAELGRKGNPYGKLHLGKARIAASKVRSGSGVIGTNYPQSCVRFLGQMWSKYRISPKGWTKLVIESNGLCGICEDQFKNHDMVVDHDHVTGTFRSLLCNRCNSQLAALENQDFCLRATLYLNKFKGDK